MKHTLLFLVAVGLSFNLLAADKPVYFNKNFYPKPLFKNNFKADKKLNLFVAPKDLALYAPGVTSEQVLGLEYLPYFFQGDGLTGVVRSGRFFFDKPFGRHFGISTGLSFNYYQISGSFNYPVYYPNSTHGNLVHINSTDFSFGAPLYATWNFSPGRKWNFSAFAGATLVNFTYGNSYLTFADGVQTNEKGGRFNFVWKNNNSFLRNDEIGFELSHAFRKSYTLGFGAGISPTYIVQQYYNRIFSSSINQFPVQFHFKVGRLVKKVK